LTDDTDETLTALLPKEKTTASVVKARSSLLATENSMVEVVQNPYV
jgi:hypothetical protein